MQPVRFSQQVSLPFLPLLLLLALLPDRMLAQRGEDEKAAVRVVERMFEALKAGDTAGMRAVMHPAARIVQTGTREGVPFNRVNSADDFLKSVAGAANRGLEERIYNPEVRIDDNLATVWVQYDFLVGGQFSHCGIDSYQLVRISDGWRILHIVDTQRRENCRKP